MKRDKGRERNHRGAHEPLGLNQRPNLPMARSLRRIAPAEGRTSAL
jgi:hypothetical protein